MKTVIFTIIIFIIYGVSTGCSHQQHNEDLPDMEYIHTIATDYATRYRLLIEQGSSEMQREEFLLNLNSRIAQIEKKAGRIYAQEFSQVFADSAFIKH